MGQETDDYIVVMFRLVIWIQECPGSDRNTIKDVKHDYQRIGALIFQGSRPRGSSPLPQWWYAESDLLGGDLHSQDAFLVCCKDCFHCYFTFINFILWMFYLQISNHISHSFSLYFLQIFFVPNVSPLLNFPAIFFRKVFFPIRWSELKTRHNPCDGLQRRLLSNHNFIIIINHASQYHNNVVYSQSRTWDHASYRNSIV